MASRSPDYVKHLLSSFLSQESESRNDISNQIDTEETVQDGNNGLEAAGLNATEPKNLELFYSRIKTYKSMNWFAKPAWLSPPHCARYGWINIDVDLLQCVSCHAFLSGRMPVSADPEVYHLCCEKLLSSLRASHNELCPWSSYPSPESFLRPQLKSKDDALEDIIEKAAHLAKMGEMLPRIPKRLLEEMGLTAEDTQALLIRIGSEDVDTGALGLSDPVDIPVDVSEDSDISDTVENFPINLSQTAALLALCGWTKMDDTLPQVYCALCDRRVGLWSYLSHSSKSCESCQSDDEEETTTELTLTSDAVNVCEPCSETIIHDTEHSDMLAAHQSGHGSTTEEPAKSDVFEEHTSSDSGSDNKHSATSMTPEMSSDDKDSTEDVRFYVDNILNTTESTGSQLSAVEEEQIDTESQGDTDNENLSQEVENILSDILDTVEVQNGEGSDVIFFHNEGVNLEISNNPESNSVESMCSDSADEKSSAGDVASHQSVSDSPTYLSDANNELCAEVDDKIDAEEIPSQESEEVQEIGTALTTSQQEGLQTSSEIQDSNNEVHTIEEELSSPVSNKGEICPDNDMEEHGQCVQNLDTVLTSSQQERLELSSQIQESCDSQTVEEQVSAPESKEEDISVEESIQKHEEVDQIEQSDVPLTLSQDKSHEFLEFNENQTIEEEVSSPTHRENMCPDDNIHLELSKSSDGISPDHADTFQSVEGDCEGNVSSVESSQNNKEHEKRFSVMDDHEHRTASDEDGCDMEYKTKQANHENTLGGESNTSSNLNEMSVEGISKNITEPPLEGNHEFITDSVTKDEAAGQSDTPQTPHGSSITECASVVSVSDNIVSECDLETGDVSVSELKCHKDNTNPTDGDPQGDLNRGVPKRKLLEEDPDESNPSMITQEPKRKKMKPKINLSQFCPLSEHRVWCPWVSNTTESSLIERITRLDGPGLSPGAGWKQLVDVLLSAKPMEACHLVQISKTTPPHNSLRSIRHILDQWTSQSSCADQSTL